MKLIYNNKEVANNTKNYNELLNKPLLNSKELVGNISLNDINVYNKKEVDNLIASTRSVKAVTALPSPLVENTMYYVGPDADNNYHVYLVDSALTLIDLGMAREESMYKAGAGIEIDSSNNIMADLDYETVSLDSEGKIYARSATDSVEGIVSYDNDSIKKNGSGKLYVPTTKSGDRWGVYPYTDSTGTTSIGKSLGFYTSDTDTGWKGVIQWDDVNRRLYLGDYTQSTPVVTVIPSGTATVGSAIQPVYVNDGIITKAHSSFIPDGATIIPNNSNLNTTAFTACGEYLCGGNASAASLTNCPTTSGFRMFVENVVSSNAGSLSDTGGWVSRTRIIENFGGARWVQGITKEGASDTTIYYGPWRRFIESDYISKFTPFTISNSLDGSKTNRSVTLPNGKVVTAEADITNRGVFLSGTGIASAARVHQSMYVLTNNVKTNNDIVVGYLLENSSASLTLNGTIGTTAVNYSQANNLGSSTSTIFKPFTADSNITQFHVDIDWLRASDTTANWWSGYGTITLSGNGGTITRASLTFICRANSPSVLPFIQLTAQSTKAVQTYYSFDIYQPSF